MSDDPIGRQKIQNGRVRIGGFADPPDPASVGSFARREGDLLSHDVKDVEDESFPSHLAS